MLKKRIPTIVGLILLILGAIGGVYFVNEKTDFLPRAAPEYAPAKVKITNITENGFTVSWLTKEPSIGFVKYGESESILNQVAKDDRDQLTGSSGEFRTHHISINGLRPQTTYFFKLGSQKNQLYDNNGQAFSLTLPNTASTPSAPDTAYGTVVTEANTPAEGAIVYITLENGTPVSTLVKQNGNWALNLSTVRTTDLSAYLAYDNSSSRLDILVHPATGEIATVVTTTGNDQPVPTITLGQQYDFSNQENSVAPNTNEESSVIEAGQEAADSAVAPTPIPENKFSSSSINPSEGEIDTSISITTMPKDGMTINTGTPELRGKAPPNVELTIQVHSNQEYTDTLISDNTGRWSWTPPGNLDPGEHTVALSYVDQEGILHKTTRTFIVDASGGIASDMSSLGYSASPSATPIPDIISAPSPSPDLPVVPTPIPTPISTPRPRTELATQSAHLVAGNNQPSLMLIITGIIMASMGLYLTRRSF